MYWQERQALNDAVERLIARGVESGAFRPVDARLAALVVLSDDEGVQNWHRPSTAAGSAGRPDGDYEVAEIAEFVADLTLRGLLADPDRPVRGPAAPPPGLTAGVDRVRSRVRHGNTAVFLWKLDCDCALPTVGPYDCRSLEVPLVMVLVPPLTPAPVAARPRARRGAGAAPPARPCVACGSDDGDDAADTDGRRRRRRVGRAHRARLLRLAGLVPLEGRRGAGLLRGGRASRSSSSGSTTTSPRSPRSAPGQLDGNSQTLNDTLVGVSAGDDQVVVLVNDNSAGNDAIIVDESINSIEDLAGKTVAAEPGVVDHFLLLQGLDSVGLTEDDIQFSGLPTADAAAAFSNGEFDAAGVFAPFTLQALERQGSKVLFDSADFPGTIPDFLVLDGDVVEERPEDVQKLVDAWYATLEWIDANPDEATAIMAEQAGVTAEEYASFAGGTRHLHRRGGARQHHRRRRRPTSARHVRRRWPRSCRPRAWSRRSRRSTACSTPRSPRTTSTARADDRRVRRRPAGR